MATTYSDWLLSFVLYRLTSRHMSKFVLTFTQNDLTLVEIYTVVLHFGLDTC